MSDLYLIIYLVTGCKCCRLYTSMIPCHRSLLLCHQFPMSVKPHLSILNSYHSREEDPLGKEPLETRSSKNVETNTIYA